MHSNGVEDGARRIGTHCMIVYYSIALPATTADGQARQPVQTSMSNTVGV